MPQALKPIPLAIAGKTYPSQSVYSPDYARTINWYPEPGQRGVMLMPTPGLSVFSTVGAGPMRAQHYINGRLIVVSGGSVYEIDSSGSIVGGIAIGNVDNDLKQCSIASNVVQTLIISAGKGYILESGVLTIIADVDFPGNINGVNALKCDYIDGYFFVLADNNTFYISALNDGTDWSAIDSSNTIETSANKLQSMIIDHKNVFVFGSRITQPLYNSGNPDFPFDKVPSGSIEQGVSAADSIAKLDNSFMMLVEDDRGGGTVCRINGYIPQQVSDFGVEFMLQRFIKNGGAINDSVAWSYQDQGHSFYVLNVPGMETTPVYDATTRLWHERASWNQLQGRYEAHRGINHIYAFNKHLVGDRELGLIYSMDIETYTDNSAPIRRLRRCTHISGGGMRVTHKKVQVFMETGVGLNVAEGLAGEDPQIILQYSDDSGNTYEDEIPCSVGKKGDYTCDVEFRSLGSTENNRVYQLVSTDPVPYRISGALLHV